MSDWHEFVSHGLDLFGFFIVILNRSTISRHHQQFGTYVLFLACVLILFALWLQSGSLFTSILTDAVVVGYLFDFFSWLLSFMVVSVQTFYNSKLAACLNAWLSLIFLLIQFQQSQSVFRRFYDIINIILFDSDSMVKIQL